VKIKEIECISEPLSAAEKKATLSLKGERVDRYTNQNKAVTVGKYEIYPWGVKNTLPQDMLAIANSNGDVLNLLSTKKDFLYGDGLGLFIIDPTSNKPVDISSLAEVRTAFFKSGINKIVRKTIASYVDTYTAPILISYDNGNFELTAIDPINVRATKIKPKETKIKSYVLCSNWKATEPEAFLEIPAFDPLKPDQHKESIYLIKPEQTGQFYYGYPEWWACEKWIKLANKISDLYNDILRMEGNIGHIIYFSKDIIQTVLDEGVDNPATNKPWTLQDLKAATYKGFDDFLFSEDKQKKLFDICEVDPIKGTMIKGIEIVPVQKSIRGDEYTATYQLCLMAITNALQIQGGLAGMSDGKMNSGGGTEIRNGAEYQQFYRTPRDRSAILDFLNTVYLPTFLKMAGISDDTAFFQFKNIQLQPLNQNKQGNQAVITNG
jgi:hypothetical protein